MIPDDESAGVPRNTGIEFTFDQPGVTAGAVRDAFSISPATKGRFEVHGKVVAFVPTKRLKAYTLYTVTLHKGVPLPGTGQKLEKDVVRHFETRGGNANGAALVIPDAKVDSAVKLAPTISIYFRNDSEERFTTPKTLPLTVHRLPSLKAAMAAYRKDRRRARVGLVRRRAHRDGLADPRPDRQDRASTGSRPRTRTTCGRGSRCRRPCRPVGTSPPCRSTAAASRRSSRSRTSRPTRWSRRPDPWSG